MRTIICTSLGIAALLITGCVQKKYDYSPIVDETYIHRYGMEVPPDHWNSSGQEGQVITTLKNGIVVTKSYSAGIQDGETTYTFPHSATIEKVEVYSQGNLVKDIIHYSSGTPKTETVYRPDGKVVINWYETGSPQSREEYLGQLLAKGEYFDPEHHLESQVDNYEGNAVNRDSYGQILSIDSIVQGQILQRTFYHPNGSPKEVVPYQNGLVHGQLKTYLPGGEPNRTEEWASGNLHGISTIYQNGERKAEVPFRNGVKHGVERRYRDGDGVVEEISWINNQKHGPSRSYIADSTVTDWYFQGEKVSKTAFDLYTITNPN